MSEEIRLPLKIVNASAGSGKTYNLVQEYLDIVLHDKNPMKFRSILAMTFTNKAANEMKKRILDGLIQLAKPEYEKTERDFKFLIDTSKNLGIAPKIIEERAAKIKNLILHNYGLFSVMTLDKFTHRIIRTFARDLNISIDFDVELDLKTLRKNVTDLLFDQIGRNDELTYLMMQYARSNLRQDKSWNFSNQVFEFSDLLFKENSFKSIELLSALSTEDFLRIKHELEDENTAIIKDIERNAKEALDLITSKGLNEEDFAGKSRSSVMTFFKNVIKREGDYIGSTASKPMFETELVVPFAHPKSFNKSTVESIEDLLAKYLDQIISAMKSSYKKVVMNHEILRNINNLSLLNHLLSLIEGLKEEQNVLLISDFYKKISEIIMDEKIPFIYERMGTRYEHFLLDEFQDTSHLQWVNMIPLIHNSLASSKQNLIVGDGKQAIYRWRNGEVEQFTGLPEKIYNPQNIVSLKEAEKLFSRSGIKMPLKENYRSLPVVVNFNNTFFKLVSDTLDERTKQIYQDVEQFPVKKNGGYIEMHLEEKMTKESQLNYVYDVVQRSLAAGYEFKDICVLVRDNKKGGLIADFLTSRGVEIISPDSLLISKERTVQFIFSLIQVAAKPTDRNAKVKCIEHFSTVVSSGKNISPISAADKNGIHLSLHEFFLEHGFELKPYTYFDNLYSYAINLCRLFKLNLKDNAYLQFFLEQIFLYEKRVNSGILDFVEWYENKGKETSIVSPEGANATQVMTVHKAKGLEFPVVICAFFDWRMDVNRQISWIENQHDKLPAFFVNTTNAIKYTDVADVVTEEESKFNLDNLNLLYVAFTRAAEALFVCSDSTKPKSPPSLWIKNTSAKMSWDYQEGFKYKKGDFLRHEKEDKSKTVLYDLSFSDEQFSKPKFSYTHTRRYNFSDVNKKRLAGTKLHLVLSKLPQNFSETDVATVLQSLEQKGILEAEEIASILSKINELKLDEKFLSYFQNKAWNEKEIVDEKGEKFIPDKIIIHPNGLLVVDFKTGDESPDHRRQILHYVSLLQNMGYENVKGELYYTESKSVWVLNSN